MSKSNANISDYYVYFEDQLAPLGNARRFYQNPRDIITAYTLQDVGAALARMEKCRAEGYHLAGYFSYELGYVLEAALRDRLPKDRTTPLLQFGVFDGFETIGLPDHSTATLSPPAPDLSFAEYRQKFKQVMALIHAGDVYQINLTFGLSGRYRGTPAALYRHLKSAQPVHYGGVVNLGEDALLTLSPELFFEQNQDHITMRPMKGTAARGVSPKQDQENANALQADPKNRAENLMIVDLLRNDLSRIAKAGTVKVPELFTVETYPSLHTMTSSVSAELPPTSIRDILKALYPCGSITGAPKIRAMEIIQEIEARPRGAYCGAIGVFNPDGSARFNVAIRTLRLARDGHYSYGVGSGVVADSDARSEYDECLLKAQFLQNENAQTDTPFGLIETFGWHADTGFMWRDLHMRRLETSAAAFGFTWSREKFIRNITDCVRGKLGAHKVRVELSKNGDMHTTCAPLKFTPPDKPWRVSLSQNPVSSQDSFRAHKTTRRNFIDGELVRLKALTNCQEILFFNERDELCEGSYTNVYITQNGQLLTPPLASGLLPGIMRQVMLESGEAVERILTIDDLWCADTIYIGNSLRGLIRVELTNLERQ